MGLKEVFGFKRSSSALDEAVDMAVGDRTDSFSPMRQNMAALRARRSSRGSRGSSWAHRRTCRRRARRRTWACWWRPLVG